MSIDKNYLGKLSHQKSQGYFKQQQQWLMKNGMIM